MSEPQYEYRVVGEMTDIDLSWILFTGVTLYSKEAADASVRANRRYPLYYRNIRIQRRPIGEWEDVKEEG